MSRRRIVLFLVMAVCTTALAGPLVSGVRMKLSAGDLPSGIAAVEDYKRDTGVDAEYLNAIGWLARGAEMLRQREVAEKYVAELHREIPVEKEGLTTPFGAAIEVESRLILARDGRGEALRYLASALGRAEDPALRSRINKNIHLLSLEGRPALAVDNTDFVGAPPAKAASSAGKVTLLFMWAHWCGDCRVQAPVLTRLWQRYRDKGLVLIAPTRYYGSVEEKKVDRAEEKKRIAQVWSEWYPGLEGVTAPIDDPGHIAYGASATPTFVLVDRKGVVRLYAPTRLSEEELARRIERLLAEPQ